ncbi:MAG: hypothetical protein JO261_02115, partial [Alphaproteobacteria bacterium]|nr:hypothetical protein [Alphaproteobacteria bacterium]
VDVLAPKSDAAVYLPPGNAKLKATPLKPEPAIPAPQRQAIAAAAKPSQAKAEPSSSSPPPSQPTVAPTAAAAAALPAEGKLTRDGAVLRFAGAARLGSAVFLRGNTAWIVLDAAAPLDAARLKIELGNFPDAVEASSGGGLSILRLVLRTPEEIAAVAEGSDLKVTIAPQVTIAASAIGFSRNLDDSAHATMTTLLAGAGRVVTLLDPVAGDTLDVIPAAPGQAMAAENDYVEFRALKTASGLVLLPLADDLEVSVHAMRVTIARRQGLSLTPPASAIAGSPTVLARGEGGPSFLDFAAWQRSSRGSFLQAERRLRAAIVARKPEEANPARLALARFYLAGNFAAEALGTIDVMQAADPALQGDRHLRTLRAAAEYEMGRYRDASKELAGAEFDNDPHAAFWRGLIAAKLENWNQAQADLDRAAAVLHRYPAEWQGRARLAAARAGLARGRLELADAALTRLPPGLAPSLMIEAQLLHARLIAQENRDKDARALFAAVESGSDPHAAAEAIYARLQSGLAARTVSRARAIAALESLRFRWRGDALEMATLRTLSSLYFAAGRWRDGLHALRIAARSFPGEDDARQAEDDMRAAFVELYLHGKADRMAPVEALSLFYDNIDLTPIGADGDEMIRRMSDRLVAVDLLGPASDLLKYQIDKRLDGVARAQVATTLAGIYLMDGKAQAALETLQATQISMLPEDVGHKRLLIEARALAALKRTGDALDLIAVDKQDDTNRLRAEIYWQGRQWPLAGATAEESLGERWNAPAPLSAGDRSEVLHAAVAYSLANDEMSLERLRTHFAAKMAGTPDADVFAAVSARIEIRGTKFRDAAAQIASIDTLERFMKEMRTR